MRIHPRRSNMIGLAVVIALLPLLCANVAATEQVPFVGCAGDGQQGPVAAPKGAAKTIAADAATASRLAYYHAQDSYGVLAPRGWNCFHVYGSSGESLVVAPDRKLGLETTNLGGPAVVATLDFGGTSGRFAVAKYAARLFAREEKAFIDGVIAEGIEPRKNFPSGPYPTDRTTFKSARIIEFETPANKDGLGASGLLLKNALPVVGVAKLEPTADGPNLFLLRVRLPADQANLASAIIAEAEAAAP